MNYVTGSLNRFKMAAEELRKEDELCDVATEVLERVEEAVMNRNPSIEINKEFIQPIRMQLEDDGYIVEWRYGTDVVVISGWADM